MDKPKKPTPFCYFITDHCESAQHCSDNRRKTMTHDTTIMLDALTKSANPITADHAKAILLGREVPMGEHYYSAEELATMGTLGAFLKTVMTGDIKATRDMADPLNLLALDIAGII